MVASRPAMSSSRTGSPRPVLVSCSTARAAHDGLAEALLVLLPLWAQSFGLSLTQAGVLKSVFHAATAAGRIPSGHLAERLGERRLLALGTLGTAVGWLLVAEADGFRALLLAVLAAGIGSGVQHSLASSLVNRAYPHGERSRAVRVVHGLAGDAGQAVVPALLALGIGIVGWRMSVWSCGVAMAVVALGVHLSLQRSVPDAPPAAFGADPAAGSVRGAAGRRDFLLSGAVVVVDAVARSAFLLLAPFLMVEKGLPVEHAGYAVMLIFAGCAAGKLGCGLVAERLGTIRTIAIAELAAALGMVAAVVAPMDVLWVLLAPIGLALGGASAALSASSAPHAAATPGLFHVTTAAAGVAAPIVAGGLGDAWSATVATAVVAAWAVVAAPVALALGAFAPSARMRDRRAPGDRRLPPDD